LKKYRRHHLVRCNACSFVYSGKEPSPDELASIYSNYPEHAALNPITEKRYIELLDRFKPLKVTGHILDAGCGSGFFLDVARRKGWRPHGSEYDLVSVKKCRERGIDMWHGALSPVS